MPHVKSVEEAKRAVHASRYHPFGNRGIGGGRTTGFGYLDLASYFRRANAEILVAVMIEDREGVEALDEILSAEGIDLVIEGAIDLSQSYGVPGQAQHPEVQSAVQRVYDVCAGRNIPFCAVPRTPDQWRGWRRRGVNAFLLGDDRGIAFRALKAHLENCRQAGCG